MARSQFIVEGGIKIVGENSNVGASILVGTGAPSADAPIGSTYQDLSNGAFYVKKVVGAGAGNWEIIVDNAALTTALGNYLALAGGTMAGSIDMDGLYQITNLAVPIADGDAATKKYVDDAIDAIPAVDLSNYLKKDGTDQMEGDLNLNTHRITNVVDPVDPQDAATKQYVVDSIDAIDFSPYLKKDGSVAMTGDLNMTSISASVAIVSGDFQVTPGAGDTNATLAFSLVFPKQGDPTQPFYIYDSATLTTLATLEKVGGVWTFTPSVGTVAEGWSFSGAGEYLNGNISSFSFTNLDASPFDGNVTSNYVLQGFIVGSNVLHKVIGVATPTLDTDAATKGYVDTEIANIPAVDLTPYLKKDGSVPIEGSFTVDLNDVHSLGENGGQFANIWATAFKSAGVMNVGTEGDGPINLLIGTNLSGNAIDNNSGNISISTGSVSGTGTRGFISLDAQYVGLNSKQIKDLANGVDPLDAVNKAQLDAAVNGLIWLDPVLDPNLFADNLADPTGVTVQNYAMYLVPNNGAGAFAGKDGHVMFYNGTIWVDLLDRAVQTGDRFGVSMYASINVPEGGLVGYDNYIAIIDDATPGGYTYNFVQPVLHDAVFVNASNSPHFGHSYTWNDVWPAGAWVEFSGPGAIEAGSGLSWSGNILNVNAGDGISIVSDAVTLVLDGAVNITGTIVPDVDNLYNIGSETAKLGGVYSSGFYTPGNTMNIATIGDQAVGKSISIVADQNNLAADVNGGAISLATGLTSGTGIRGQISLDGAFIDVNNNPIKNVADPVALQDAVNLQYLERAIAYNAAINITTAAPVDGVDVTKVTAVKWLVEVIEEATPANKQAFEIMAMTDGVNADFTQYAKLTLGAAFNLTVDVQIVTGQMQLILASTSAGVAAKVKRIPVSSASAV